MSNESVFVNRRRVISPSKLQALAFCRYAHLLSEHNDQLYELLKELNMDLPPGQHLRRGGAAETTPLNLEHDVLPDFQLGSHLRSIDCGAVVGRVAFESGILGAGYTRMARVDVGESRRFLGMVYSGLMTLCVDDLVVVARAGKTQLQDGRTVTTQDFKFEDEAGDSVWVGSDGFLACGVEAGASVPVIPHVPDAWTALLFRNSVLRLSAGAVELHPGMSLDDYVINGSGQLYPRLDSAGFPVLLD